MKRPLWGLRLYWLALQQQQDMHSHGLHRSLLVTVPLLVRTLTTTRLAQTGLHTPVIEACLWETVPLPVRTSATSRQERLRRTLHLPINLFYWGLGVYRLELLQRQDTHS